MQCIHRYDQAIFLLIIGATYTGATAAALVAGNANSEITNLEDVLKLGGKLCIRKAMASSFVLRHPNFAGKLQARDKATELLQDLDENNCLAALIMQDAWDKIADVDERHCKNKVALEGTCTLTARSS